MSDCFPAVLSLLSHFFYCRCKVSLKIFFATTSVYCRYAVGISHRGPLSTTTLSSILPITVCLFYVFSMSLVFTVKQQHLTAGDSFWINAQNHITNKYCDYIEKSSSDSQPGMWNKFSIMLYIYIYIHYSCM